MTNKPEDVQHGDRLGRAVQTIMALSLIPAILVPYWQSHSATAANNPQLVAATGFAAMLAAGLLGYLLIRRLDPQNPFRWYLVFFIVFSFTCWIDLFIAFTRWGLTDLMSFYFEKGEPYLKTAHGFAINLWDGTVHLALYMAMAWSLAHRRLPARLGMFWVGSIMTATVTFMLGNIVGPYARMIEPAILLNLVFMMVPVSFAMTVMRRTEPSSAGSVGPILKGLFLLVAAICVFRAAAALGPDAPFAQHWVQQIDPYMMDPSRYLEIQTIALGLYFVIFGLFVAASKNPPSQPLKHISWFMAGFATQAATAHVAGRWFDQGLGSVHPWLLLVSLLLFIVPLAYAWKADPCLRAGKANSQR